MARRYHPYKNSVPEAAQLFIQAREAFVVLDDPEARKRYDASIQQTREGAQATATGNEASCEQGREETPPSMPEDPPVYKDLPLTLEGISRSTTNKYRVTRKIGSDDGDCDYEERVMTLEIRPGVLAGTEYKLQEASDKRKGHLAGVIVFVVVEKPHHVFRISGMDVSAVLKIAPGQARKGSTVQVPLIAGAYLNIVVADDVKTGDTLRFTGKGLPSPSGTTG
ncbi:dnaJ homolog subfamily B member 13 [Rhipicephalus sanguineus]|nr:dnaJ homolog subfamily B member 13 [Rhipicephalus sanguineus]